jgi:translation initiation factor eIF-2B subunit epsilon
LFLLLQVLGLFNTHFDFQDIRGDFIRGVLAEEVMEDKIRVHITSQGYAARVKDFRTYDSVNKDIIHRWTYPLVPDNNISGLSSYQLSRKNIYQEPSISLARFDFCLFFNWVDS